MKEKIKQKREKREEKKEKETCKKRDKTREEKRGRKERERATEREKERGEEREEKTPPCVRSKRLRVYGQDVSVCTGNRPARSCPNTCQSHEKESCTFSSDVRATSRSTRSWMLLYPGESLKTSVIWWLGLTADINARRSTSGGLITYRGTVLMHLSKMQANVALSSAEAGVNATVKGLSELIGVNSSTP